MGTINDNMHRLRCHNNDPCNNDLFHNNKKRIDATNHQTHHDQNPFAAKARPVGDWSWVDIHRNAKQESVTGKEQRKRLRERGGAGLTVNKISTKNAAVRTVSTTQPTHRPPTSPCRCQVSRRFKSGC